MTNTHPYPLPFPNEAQRMQMASYSSLANALATDPGRAIPHRRASWAACDVVTNTHSIYADGLPINNPSYPYPARNVLNPSTYLARTSLPASSGRNLSCKSVTCDEDGERKDLPGIPSRYDRLPQPYFVEQGKPYGRQAGAEFPTIHFLRKGNKEPYTLRDLLSMNAMPDLADGDLPILFRSPDREIKIKLIWPGYLHYPFEKRILIKRDPPLTLAVLMMILAYHMEKFVRWIHNEGAVAEAGYEHWTIGGVIDPALWKNCTITSLQHRMGSIWQPEIYYPRE